MTPSTTSPTHATTGSRRHPPLNFDALAARRQQLWRDGARTGQSVRDEVAEITALLDQAYTFKRTAPGRA